MAFQTSPGISVSETDLTAGTQQVSVSDAAMASPFQWGPALAVTNIASEDELVRQFGKPNDTIASHWLTASSFLSYANRLRVARAISSRALNSTVSARALTGTVTAGNANAIFVGANSFTTGYGTDTPTIVEGQTVLIGATSYTVNAVLNVAAFSVTTAPSGNVVANTISAYGTLVKNSDHYDTSFSSGVSGFGAWAGKYPGDLGNSLKVSVCSSANAFSDSDLTGTITLTAGSNTVTGSGTSFTTELIVGDFITANGSAYPVVAITNTTSLIVGTAPTTTSTPASGSWGRRWQYATLFDRAPGTSAFAAARGGSSDEMHAVVVDEDGSFSGTPGTVLERYAFVSKAVNGKNSSGEASYYADVLNAQSAYIWWLTHPGTTTTNWGGQASSTFGTDDIPSNASLLGGQTDNANLTDGNLQTAYDLFKSTDSADVSLLISGPASATLASYIITNIAESRQDCVAFVSPSRAAVVQNAGSEVAAITAFRNSLPSSSFGFMDGNWKYMYDKYNDKHRWVPLNGDIAGIAARADTGFDPWISPAGHTRGNVKNVVKLAWNPREIDRDDLYKIGVNPVATFAGQGVVLYGDKTLLNRPSAFDRINVRRLFIVVEKTIKRLAQSQLFEYNDEFSRSQFRNTVEPFLRDVKSRRGIVDFRVVCDDSNNTTSVIEQNKFVGDIFIKPARSINFIQLNFTAVGSGVSFQEVASPTI